MNLTGRSVAQKASKIKKNPGYLKKVRQMPCIICETFGEQQTSPTEAHHVIQGRYSTKKTPDEMAIPLCGGHHLGTFDTSKGAIHREPEKWRRLYGPDHDYSARVRASIQRDEQ